MKKIQLKQVSKYIVYTSLALNLSLIPVLIEFSPVSVTVQESQKQSTSESDIQIALSKVDMSQWLYNSDDDVYYQIGLNYVENPSADNQQTFSPPILMQPWPGS